MTASAYLVNFKINLGDLAEVALIWQDFLHDKINKKVLGKFKDEMNGKIITKFISLRPKMYSISVQTPKEEKKNKKAKGVPRNKVMNELTMKDYEDALREQSSKDVTFNAIRK